MKSSRGKRPTNTTGRWKDRFHRNVLFDLVKNENQKWLSVFITRPTFEKIRSSNKCRETIDLIRRTLHDLNPVVIDRFGNDVELPKSEGISRDINWKGATDSDFVVGFHRPDTDSSRHIIVSGPYNVESEMSNCSSAILIDIYDGEIELKFNEDAIDNPIKLHRYLNQNPIYQLGQFSDEYASIYESLVKRCLGDNTYFEQLAFDLNAARLLPTSYLLQNINHNNIRKLVSQQFNEIRLIDDSNKVNFEQVSALNRYTINESPMQNLSGRPGTGKSTIQHILVCEYLLQPGEYRSSRKILYLATTTSLIDEARDEIRSILAHVYLMKRKDVNMLLKRVNFVIEEDLFLRPPSFHEKLTKESLTTLIRSINQEISKRGKRKQNFIKRWKHWLDINNTQELFRIIETFVYGVFGSITNFLNWTNESAGDYKTLFASENINLVNPNNKSSAHITPLYFWNPWDNKIQNLTKEEEEKGNHLIKSLISFLSDNEGLKPHLQDCENNQQGIWSPSGMIYTSAKLVEENNEEHKGAWKIANQTGFDCIFVDESQDFSAVTLSILLEKFSNRKDDYENNRRPFVFICTGDEYQTVRGNLFQGNMLHINNMYNDWLEMLIHRSNDATWTLADGLRKPFKASLIANYRNFDTAVEVINCIVKKMYSIGELVMPNLKRGVKSNVADVERKGFLASSFMSNESEINSSSISAWEDVTRTLLKQIENEKEPTKVALILPTVGNEIRNESINHYLDKILNTEVCSSSENLADTINKIKSKINYYFENDTDNKTLSDFGIFDVESIKGLTVPVVITFYEDVEKRENAWDQMQGLSHILVAVSRAQFGLFIITDTFDDFIKITNQEDVIKNTLSKEEEDDDASSFRDLLIHMTTAEIPESVLLLQAIKSPYSKANWNRLRTRLRRFKEEGDTTDDFLNFVQKLSEIATSARERINSDTSILDNKFESLIEFRDNSKDEIEFQLNGEFLIDGEKNYIKLLEFFIRNNLISRTLYMDDDETLDEIEMEELFTHNLEQIKQIFDKELDIFPEVSNFDNTQEDTEISFAEDIMSSNFNTYSWLKLIYSNKNHEHLAIQDFDKNPWDSNRLELRNIEYPSAGTFPRIKISPWYFPKPKNEDFIKIEPWMTEQTFWTVPPELVVRLIKSNHNLDNTTTKKYEWLARVIHRDVKALVKFTFEKAEENDLVALNWLICILCQFKEIGSLKNQFSFGSQLLQETTHHIVDNEISYANFRKLISGYRTIDELEAVMGLIYEMNISNNKVKDVFDQYEIAKTWSDMYKRKRTKLNKISTNVINFMGIYNSIYSDAFREINSLITVKKNNRRPKAQKREAFEDVLKLNEQDTNMNVISGNNVLENIISIETSYFLPINDTKLAKDFRRIQLDILDINLHQMLVGQPYSDELIESIYQTSFDSNKKGQLDFSDAKPLISILSWLFGNIPFGNALTYPVLEQINGNIRDAALDRLTSPLVFRKKPMKNLAKLVFDPKSILSQMIQLGFGREKWYNKPSNTWGWRNSGHNFWNTTTLKRGYAALEPVDRFKPMRDVDPQFYVNNKTLNGFIQLYKFLEDEDYSDNSLDEITSLFVTGGDAKSAKQTILIEILLTGDKSISNILQLFSKYILVLPAIYFPHVQKTSEESNLSQPSSIRGYRSISNNAFLIPNSILSSEILDSYRCSVSEMQSVLSHSAVSRIWDDALSIYDYFRFDSNGRYLNDDGILEVERITRMKKEVGQSLRKHFENAKYFQELILLSKLLSQASKLDDIKSIQDFQNWFEELISSKHETELFMQGKNPLEEDHNIYLNAKNEVFFTGLTKKTFVDFSSKRFTEYFSLLKDILQLVTDREQVSADERDLLLKKYFSKNSIIEVLGLNGDSANKELLLEMDSHNLPTLNHNEVEEQNEEVDVFEEENPLEIALQRAENAEKEIKRLTEQLERLERFDEEE